MELFHSRIKFSNKLFVNVEWKKNDSGEPMSDKKFLDVKKFAEENKISILEVNIFDVDETSENESIWKDQIDSFLEENKAYDHIYLIGKKTVSICYPELLKSTDYFSLVESPIFSYGNKSVAVFQHPNFLMNKESNIKESYENRLFFLEKSKSTRNIEIVNVESDEDFIDLLNFLDSDDSKYHSLDYETNAIDPMNENFYVTLLSIAIFNDSENVTSFKWENKNRTNINPKVCEKLGWYFERNAKRIWAFNCSFEIKVTYHLTGKFIKFQDTLVLLTMHGKRAGLKRAAMNELGELVWDEQIQNYIETMEKVFKLCKLEEQVEFCKSGDLDSLLESFKTKASVLDPLKSLIDLYGEDIVKESITHYPYAWGSVPKIQLGNYCCKDTGNTLFLTDKFNTEEIQRSYNFYMNHPYLAARFELNGVPWKDNYADELLKDIDNQLFDLLYSVICELDSLNPQEKLLLMDTKNKALPYERETFTPSGRSKMIPINTVSDKIEELKTILNPGSNTAESRNKFYNSYTSEEVLVGTLLLTLANELDFTGDLTDFVEIFGSGVLKSSDPIKVIGEIMEKLDTLDEYTGNKYNKRLGDASEHSNDHLGKYTSDIIKFQYKVHTNYLGVNIEDESTWNDKFKMLFNLFYYKKLAKMSSTNINGSTGRALAYEVVGELHGKPLRGRHYFDIPLEEREGLEFVVNNEFNPLSAASTRWSSGFHTNPPTSPGRRCFDPGDGKVMVHMDFSQAEIVTLAFLSQDPGLLQIFLDGKDMHRFVASILYQKEYDDVTSQERRAAKGASFGVIYGKSIESLAIDMTDGDVPRAKKLFETFFASFPGIKTWMDEKKDEVDQFDYVTTALGNNLVVDTGNEGGNAKYRVACLAGDTEIIGLDGKSYKISELVGKEDFYGYSYDSKRNRIIPSKVEKIWKTKEVNKTLRITLDNNEVLECTEDHLILLRSKDYIRADELKVGDILMSLSKCKVAKTEEIHHNKSISVYDLSVPIYHNIALDSGIFVHNCNLPIQGLSSTVAGTYMNKLTELYEELGFETNPYGFTHDAYDDITSVDTIFDYLEIMVEMMNKQIYEDMGMPMKIDYEIGANSYDICGIKIKERNDKELIFELEGNDASIEGVLDRFSQAKTYQIVDVKELSSKTEHHSFETLFTVGRALDGRWGKTITYQTVGVTINFI